MYWPVAGGGLPLQQQAAKSLAHWTKFLDKARHDRLDHGIFDRFVPRLQAQNPLGPNVLADLFLRPTPGHDHSVDSRVLWYFLTVMDLDYVDTPSILGALYRYSTSHSLSGGSIEDEANREAKGQHQGEHETAADTRKPGKFLRYENSYSMEEFLFYRLTKIVAPQGAGLEQQGTHIRTMREALEVAVHMANWMKLFTTANAAFADDVMGQVHNTNLRLEMEGARAGFVMLLLGFCENEVVLQALSKPTARGVRKLLSESLASFVPTILQSSPQIAGRLELFRTETLAGFEPVDRKKDTADTEIDELLDATMGLDSVVIPELPIANSRAGLFIYLNAALVGRPLIDDAAFHSYLHNRYQGDLQTTAIDLILASFDVLANAIYRNEGQKSAHLLRSYLINKVPLILAQFAASASHVYPFDSELCITTALGHVDTNTFPTISSMFENSLNSNPFTESVRQDFCWACCLHNLVPEASIDKLIGDYTYQTLPAGGRYSKDHLVQECIADNEKMSGLITELDSMDGNVGAVCQALTEMLGRLCNNKETMPLKTLCGQLAQKPTALDVLLLFDNVRVILHPLCELLDNWRYEEDQGEYQPVYEEFGSVLLLLLAFVYRYNLSVSDLGVRSADSFVVKLLSKGHLSRQLSELNEQEKKQLGGWTRGLFDTETGGLTDDLMSSCPPQDFYLLVPTLFHQIILAYSTNNLPEESLRTGVEYLVDTFLLPSLVTAIMYLSDCLWLNRPDEQKAVIKILQLILEPNQISTEATLMLSSVLNIVAKPLEKALRTYLSQNPKSQDIDPLLKALRPHIELSRRTGAADHNELESWTSTNNGGLTAAIRHAFQGLVQWGMNPGNNVLPTSYTHRQILVCLKLLNAERLLSAILEELKQQTEAGNGSVAYDVATALVCAPDVTSAAQQASLLDEAGGVATAPPQQRQLVLRETLKWRAEKWKKIQKTDSVMAETVVRLYRKVEAQMVVNSQTVLQPADLDGMDGAAALGDAAGAAGAASLLPVADHMALDTGGLAGLDLGAGAGDLSLGASSANSAGGLDFSGDDMFASVDSLGGWEGMELT